MEPDHEALTREQLIEQNALLRRRLDAAERAIAGSEGRVSETELRREGERLRLIVEGVRDHAISMLDADGNVVTFNAAAEHIKGYTLDEVKGRYFAMFFTPEDRAAGLPETELRVARTTGRYEGEGWRQRKDGSRFYAAVALSALEDSSGELVGYVKVTQDRTRDRDLAEALQRREDQLRLIIDGVRDHAISLLDPEGRVQTFNAPAERIKGYTLDEVRGQYFGMFFTPADREAGVPAAELEVARSKGRFEGEGWRRRKDGSLFYAMVSLSALYGSDGSLVGYVKVTQNITERRRLLEELRVSRENAEREHTRLKQMFDALPAMISLLEGPELRFAFVSPSAAQEIARPIGEVLGRPVADVIGAAPGTLAAFREVYTRGETLTRTEIPVTRDFGRGTETRYISSSLIPLRDPRGVVDGLLVFSHDLTDEIRARQALQDANDKLRVVLEGVGDGITMQSADGTIVYANEAAAASLGAASAADLLEARGESISSRFAFLDENGDPMPPESLATHRAFAGETVTNALVSFRAAHGGPRRWSIVSATPVLDGRGGVRFVVNIFKDVTEQRESERRFRAVFDSARDAMLICDDTRAIVEVNDAACAMLTRTRGDIVGRRVEDLVVASEGDRPSSVTSIFGESAPPRGELEFVIANGGVRRMEYTASTHFVPGRHLAVLRDVTERRVAEDSLRFLADVSVTLASSLDYERTLASLVHLCVPTLADWASVDMLVDDSHFERLAVAHVDPAKVELAREMWERQPPSLGDEHGVAKVVRTGQPEILHDIPDSLLVASIGDPELLEKCRSLGLTSSMVLPLTVRGRTIGAFGLVMGAESGRRFRDEDLLLAQQVANRASIAIENAMSYREAQEASRLKDEFLATVSHELRTPLTAVLGWAVMLRTRQHDPSQMARAIDTIERNARAQAQLIEDLLDLSRVITGKMRLQLDVVDVAHVVETAVDTIRPAAAAKQIAIAPSIDPRAPAIRGDADRILQIVNNLLTNAVKFTPKGGRVGATVRRHESSVEIVVEDDGTGIEPAFLPHVFERFRQAEGGTSRSHGGLGLGLAISRSLVEMHGGTITAHSEGLGKGATFVVRLPVAALGSSEMPPVKRDRTSLSGGFDCPMDLDEMRVLVVDDDTDSRELVRAVLEHCGARVATASSALDALKQLREGAFDVLVSDIGMPNVDGHALIREARASADPSLPRLAALALTAFATSGDRMRALRAGFDAHLAKPIEPSVLVASIASLVGRYAAT